MITCHLKYQIDPSKIKEFEIYAKAWIALVERFGGVHHGYFLPQEGPNDLAYAAFSFNSLAEYEKYREDSMKDKDCQAAFQYATDTACIIRYDRYYLRTVLQDDLGELTRVLNEA